MLHRIDGPAIISDYAKEYFKNGVRHNLGGPAVIYTDGRIEKWSYGIRVDE
jgi:hypothetical protein